MEVFQETSSAPCGVARPNNWRTAAPSLSLACGQTPPWLCEADPETSCSIGYSIWRERRMSGNSARTVEYGSCKFGNRMDGLTDVDVVNMPLTWSCVCEQQVSYIYRQAKVVQTFVKGRMLEPYECLREDAAEIGHGRKNYLVLNQNLLRAAVCTVTAESACGPRRKESLKPPLCSDASVCLMSSDLGLW